MNGFSVIMPTYNQCSFIRRAIKSLCTQNIRAVGTYYRKWRMYGYGRVYCRLPYLKRIQYQIYRKQKNEGQINIRTIY
jgi:hypothetical protein